MKLTFDFSGKTLLKDWWRQVKTLFEETENAVNAEESSRISGDNTLKENIDAETAQRINADNVLRNNINTEISERKTAVNDAYSKAVEGVSAAAEVRTNLEAEARLRKNSDSSIEQNLQYEISSRKSADSGLDTRVTALEGKAHAHSNKTALDTITADDIEKWNGIKAQVSKAELDNAINAEVSERERYDLYSEGMLYGITDEIKRIYGAVGIVLAEGGLFGMERLDAALDGGAFDDADLTLFDCGSFETAAAAVMDGGSY